MGFVKSKMGAIFPISSENVMPLFDEGKTIFVKYTKFRKLEKGSKIVFYVSKEKILIGEGTAEKIEMVSPEIAWARYGKEMFLNKMQYNRYVTKSPVSGRNREMEEITVFVLKNLTKYRNPVQWKHHNITPSGRYLTREKYQRIRT